MTGWSKGSIISVCGLEGLRRQEGGGGERGVCIKLHFKQRGWNEQMLEMSKWKLAEDHRIIKELDISCWLKAYKLVCLGYLNVYINYYWP